MNNPGYKRAVEDGLIPNQVQQAVYLTRDKIVKNAMKKAMEEMSGVTIGDESRQQLYQERGGNRNWEPDH